MSEDRNEAIHAVMQQQEIDNVKSSLTRGRSLACGTCFNGMVEVIIRGDGNKILWVILSPQETGELIHQLTAAIGCTATLAPRNDFLDYRGWQAAKQKE